MMNKDVTLKSIDYNVAMTFIFNNNNNNIIGMTKSIRKATLLHPGFMFVFSILFYCYFYSFLSSLV